MNCLLLGGAQSVGKSEAVLRLANYLIYNKHFIDIHSKVPHGSIGDFYAILEGFDKKNRKIRIIINSATDTTDLIKNFKQYFDKNGKYDIMISSIRDDNFWPRSDFFKIMDLGDIYILEIPLAKITRRMANFSIALTWYKNKIDNTINHILGENPFEV